MRRARRAACMALLLASLTALLFGSVVGSLLVPCLWAQQPASPAAPPPCDEQLRITVTRYDIKKQQAELAEQNVAQLLEQLRQAQAQNAELRGEVEKLKNGTTRPAN